VTAAKASFCQSHTDENDFCYVEGGLLPWLFCGQQEWTEITEIRKL
jgi:hypothetical protein